MGEIYTCDRCGRATVDLDKHARLSCKYRAQGEGEQEVNR